MSRLTAVSPILGTRKKSVQHSGKKVPGRDTWAGLIRFAAIDHAARTPTKNGSVIVRALHNARPCQFLRREVLGEIGELIDGFEKMEGIEVED